MKKSDKIDQVPDISIWTVWYEDRFGLGPDRDPASIVALFANKREAEHYVNTQGGPIDSEKGRFDGLFVSEWLVSELINAKLADITDIQNLLDMKPPKKLLRHWEKGWI